MLKLQARQVHGSDRQDDGPLISAGRERLEGMLSYETQVSRIMIAALALSAVYELYRSTVKALEQVHAAVLQGDVRPDH
jgi:hypothetical protein